MLRLRVLVALTLALGAAGVLARQEPQFRGATNAVSIYATVVDASGRLVTDLRREDFEVFDNGVRQDLSVFANDRQPITIVVMLDRSGSMRPHFERVRDAAEVFVGNLLPGDRARLGSFSDQIRIDPDHFTGDRDTLVRILHENLQDAGPTPLWNATGEAMDALRAEEGRRVILVFTDGKDTPGVGRNTDFAEVRTRSQVEEVMVYGIGFAEECADDMDGRRPRAPWGGGGPILFQRGPGGGGGRGGPLPPGLPGGGSGRGWPGVPTPRYPPPGPSIPGMPPIMPPIARPGSGPAIAPCAASGPDPDLRELAAVGGGGYFELHKTDDLRATFARVADELHHQYLLAFTAAKLDNRLHRLDVRVRSPQWHVRARRTYLAD